MIGKWLDEFKIIKTIGEGGVGQVFLAIQESLDREVAIKIINSELGYANSKIIKRFMHEAKSMAAITHPNIVSIHKVGVADGVNYIVMEYIDGSQLDTFFSNRPFNRLKEKMVWETFYAIVNGLYTALQHGIIHRDIKPGNILIDSNYVPKITDFGIAKNLEQDMGLTFEGVIMGSPSYISPEQAAGGDMLYHTDMYSLGASLYHILTNELLFPGNVLVDVLYKQISSSPLSPQKHVNDLSDNSTFILAKLLHKRPEQRYLSYSDLLLDISLLLEDRSLIYADDSDALAVFDYEGNPPKYSHKNNFFANLLTRSYLNITKQVKSDILWVSNRQPQLNESLQQYFNIHYINSIAELKFAIAKNNYLIVFDMSYIDSVLLKYLNTIYKEAPTAKIVLLSTLSPPAQLENLFIKAETEREISDKINSKKKTFVTVAELSFNHITALIEIFQWSLVMRLNGANGANRANNGSIIFHHGKYSDKLANNEQKLSKTVYDWEIGNQELPSNWVIEPNKPKVAGIKTKKQVAQNQKIKLETEAKVKPLLFSKPASQTPVDNRPSPELVKQSLKARSDKGQVQQRITTPLNLSNPAVSTVLAAIDQTDNNRDDKSAPGTVKLNNLAILKEQPATATTSGFEKNADNKKATATSPKINGSHNRKVTSLISELDQAWDSLLIKRKQGNSISKSSISIDKTIADDDPQSNHYNQFTLLMDKAIEQFLHKHYDQAYEYLLKAKQINPNAPILKMNLRRLETMGYGKK